MKSKMVVIPECLNRESKPFFREFKAWIPAFAGMTGSVKPSVLLVGSLILLILSACERNPVDRLVNANLDGQVPQTSGTFMIFDDELKTGGGLGFIPAGENQSIDLKDTSSPRRGVHHVRYAWNGQDVASQHLFAGFSFLVTENFSGLNAATGKDLSAVGYTTLRLFVRGSLSNGTRLRIEGPDDGDGGNTAVQTELSSLSSNWQEVTLAVPASHFSNVKVFITVSFQFTQPPRTTAPGEGGTVFLDDIRYVR